MPVSYTHLDIKIARVDEAGSIDFVVYGYMNRGDHEGEVGTAVYHLSLIHIFKLKNFQILKSKKLSGRWTGCFQKKAMKRLMNGH